MNETLLTQESWNSSDITNISTSTNHTNIDKLEPDLPPYIVIILIIIGTIGNVLVCLTIYLDKKLQNMTNFFLLSLAVTDLLVNTLILPARIAIYVYVLQPHSFPWCILHLVGDDYLTSASALHICFISFERYLAIKNPLDRRNLTHRRVYIKMSLVWFISFLTIIPYLTISIVSDYPTRSMYCPKLLAYMKPLKVILYMESLVIFVMMAVVIFSFTGTSILLYKLAQKQTDNGGMGMVRTVGVNKSESAPKKPATKLQELNTEKRAMRVIWLVSFAFVMTMGPYAVVNIIYLISPGTLKNRFALKLVAYLAYSNSVINPILYTIFNKQFRRNFIHIILLKYKQL